MAKHRKFDLWAGTEKIAILAFLLEIFVAKKKQAHWFFVRSHLNNSVLWSRNKNFSSYFQKIYPALLYVWFLSKRMINVDSSKGVNGKSKGWKFGEHLAQFFNITVKGFSPLILAILDNGRNH